MSLATDCTVVPVTVAVTEAPVLARIQMPLRVTLRTTLETNRLNQAAQVAQAVGLGWLTGRLPARAARG